MSHNFNLLTSLVLIMLCRLIGCTIWRLVLLLSALLSTLCMYCCTFILWIFKVQFLLKSQWTHHPNMHVCVFNRIAEVTEMRISNLKMLSKNLLQSVATRKPVQQIIAKELWLEAQKHGQLKESIGLEIHAGKVHVILSYCSMLLQECNARSTHFAFIFFFSLLILVENYAGFVIVGIGLI